MTARELALGRGGDQVVIKNNEKNKIQYIKSEKNYGNKTMP